MNYFQYNTETAGVRSPSEMIKIYSEVRALEKYAKSIYHSRWEDALDMAFFHVIQNYNSGKGDLSNYVLKVVGGIGLGQFKNEYPYEYISELGDDELRKVEGTIENTKERNTDMTSCIRYLAPFFIKDFKFFENYDTSHRKESYKELFEKYSASVVQQASDYLRSTYSEELQRFYKIKRTCRGKKYSSGKIEKSFDESVVCLGEINDTLIFRRNNCSKFSKYFYSVDLNKTVAELIDKYYANGEVKAFVEVAGVKAFITMYGKIVFDVDSLILSLKKDIVGTILAREKLKLFKLTDEDAVFVTSSSLGHDLNMSLFGEEFWFRFSLRPSKEVSRKYA